MDHRFGKTRLVFPFPRPVAAGSPFSNSRDWAHSIRAKNSRTVDSTTHVTSVINKRAIEEAPSTYVLRSAIFITSSIRSDIRPRSHS